jgi:polyhydroxyalkanoate synthase subunit PhaC
VWDHVAPWRSTHKIHLLADTDVTHVLTSGGHNAGIVSALGRADRFHQAMTKKAEDHYPDTWLATAPRQDGSWWPTLAAWLGVNSGTPVKAPPMGDPSSGHAPLCDAPGTYVLED